MWKNLIGKKNLITTIICIFITLFTFISILSIHSKNIKNNLNVDEIHTIVWGVNNQKDTQRVGEANRFYVKILMYPAQYYLNTVLGGEHFVTGWDFARNYHKNIRVEISGDPSLQDYVFFLKLLNTLIVLTIVLLIAFSIQKLNKNFNALIWIIISHLWLIKTSFFSMIYSHTTVTVSYLLIVLVYLNKERFEDKKYFFLIGILSSFAVFSQLTALIFAPIILWILIEKNQKFIFNWNFEFFFMGFILVVIVLFYNTSFFEAMNQYLSNVYHYKTGHLWTVTEKMTYLEAALKFLKLPFVLLIISIFGFFLSKKKETLYILIIASSIIGTYSLIDNSVFMSRNLIIIGIMITTAISIQNYSEHSLNNILLYKSVKIISLNILILFYLFAGPANGINFPIYYSWETESSFLENINTENCKNIGSISLGPKIYKKLEDFPMRFNLRDQGDELFEPYQEYDCLLVKRTKNNKHITNYFALKQGYRLEERSGNLFYFRK